MATIAKLDVLLGLEDGAFQRGLESSRQKLDKWGSSLRSAGTKMTAGITAPIVGSGLMFVNWAADLEQTLGATEQLWGSNANTIINWSDTASTAMGLTQDEALTSANRFNALLGDLDDGMGNVADMSMELTERSADLSAMWGGSSIEASDALTGALRGNYEGLDKYNINITGAMVNTEAMAIAVADGRDEITEADKTQARYNLIMEQSADAQGQFARETDTTSGKLAIAKARIKDAGTAFGRLLLPYVNKAVDIVSKFVTFVENLNDTQRKWVIGIAAVAAAMGPLLIIVGMLLPGIGALVAVIGFLVSPIGLIVIAVAALVAGLVWAYFEFEAFREIVDSVASVIRDVAVEAFDKLVEAFNKLKDAFDSGGFSEMFSTLGEMALNGITQLSQAIQSGISWIAQRFVEWAGDMLAAGGTWLQGLWDGAAGKWNEFTGWLGGLAADAATWIADTASTLWQKGVDLIVGIGNGAVAQWANFTTWVGNRSAQVVAAIGGLLATLWQKGVDLIVGLGNGAVTQWTNFTTWVGQRGPQAFVAIGNVARTLWQKGVDLIIGLGEGATTQWNNLRTWIANRGPQANSAVGNVLRSLWQKGVDLIIGLGDGVTTQWGNLRTWLSGMGSRIVSAVGSLGSSLYNAGLAVMSGLKDGLVAGWNDVTGWLSGLNPADWKGPERRDKKMLYMPGIWIMEGLQRGLAEGWQDTTRQLSSYTPMINGDLNAAHAGMSGSQIINHNYFVTPEALKEMIEGGKFAREFAGELNMSEGVA